MADADQNILPRDGTVCYFPGFFTTADSDHYFALLLREVAWQQQPVVIAGREIMQPRLTAWYGAREYTYSGMTMRPLPWIPVLVKIRQRVEKAAQHVFNSALLNQYRDGKDSVGWHRDNEKALGDRPVIASVSFGATRKFDLRHYHDRDLKRTLLLEHGSLLLMRDETQHCWFHRLPKSSGISAPRINITFRTIR